MEMIATSVDQLENVGQNPYHIPAGVESNLDEWGSPYSDMIGSLHYIAQLLDRIANTADAAREQPRQTMIPLTAVVFNTTVRFRVTEIVLDFTAAAALSLVVGSLPQRTWLASAAATLRFPYITIIDRGTDLSLTASGGATPTGYLVGYPE